MPRLHEVTRAEASDPLVLQCYDALFGPDRDPVESPGTATGTPGDWWTVFANSPRVLAHAVAGFRLYQGSADRLDPVLRELGQTRAGWLIGSQFVFSQHCKSLRALGVGDDKIAAVPAWGVAECFSPIERAVLSLADALATGGGRVPDGVFEVLKAELDDAAVLELAYITATYVLHATLSRALRTEFDDVDERVVEVGAPEGAESRDIGADIAVSRPDA